MLIGFAASLLIVGLYALLSKRYAGMSLPQINSAVFGRAVGKIVTVLYVFYFVSLALLNTRDLGDFIASSVLRQTPRTLIFVVFIAVCAWAVRKGPVNMTRYAFLATTVSIAAILTNTLFLADKNNPQNLLPAFTLPVRNYLIGAHIVTMLSARYWLLCVYTPQDRPLEFAAAMRKGQTIAAVMRFCCGFGIRSCWNRYLDPSMPCITPARYINIGDVLTRVEYLHIVLVALMFFKVSVVYYAGESGSALHETNHTGPMAISSALYLHYAAALPPIQRRQMENDDGATFRPFSSCLPLLTCS